MKRFTRSLIAFLTVQVILFVGAVAVFYRPDRHQYLAANIAKHALLAQTPAPRVIFVGASNLPFTLNSEVIEKETGYHPINMGLAYSLGLQFSLAEVKPYVRRDDVVVLSFPYEWFDWPKPDPDAVWRLLEIHPALLWRLSRHELAEILPGQSVFGYMGRIVRAIVRTAVGRHPAVETPFPTSAFNRFGDIVTHWSQPLPKRRRMTLTLVREYSVESSDLIQRLLRVVAARGGHVLYLFPPVPEEVFQNPSDRQFIDRVEAELTGNLRIRTMNRPVEVLMPSASFFDNAYHLTGPAVQTYSSFVAARLRATLPSLGVPPGDGAGRAR